MNRTRRRTMVVGALLVCAGGVLIAGLATSPPASAQVKSPTLPLPPPKVPQDGRLAPARAISDLRSAVEQSAALVEGVVSAVETEYSDEAGPWTRVTLTEVEPHFGEAPRKLVIRHFGGMLPSGRLMVAAELPVFVKDRRYLVFLRNTSWNVSSVVGSLAFRVEQLGGDEVLVDSEGHPVLAVGAAGFDLGPALFDGHELDGSPPKPIVQDVSKLERKPLHRKALLESLRSTFAVEQLSVKGTYNDKPGGEFRWRAQQLLPATDDDGRRGDGKDMEKDSAEDKQ